MSGWCSIAASTTNMLTENSWRDCSTGVTHKPTRRLVRIEDNMSPVLTGLMFSQVNQVYTYIISMIEGDTQTSQKALSQRHRPSMLALVISNPTKEKEKERVGQDQGSSPTGWQRKRKKRKGKGKNQSKSKSSKQSPDDKTAPKATSSAPSVPKQSGASGDLQKKRFKHIRILRVAGRMYSRQELPTPCTKMVVLRRNLLRLILLMSNDFK